jgi:hypothetical protein
MIYYIPVEVEGYPLMVRIVDLDEPPKVKPRLIRALWQARAAEKARYGYPVSDCQEWAAQDVAKMTGYGLAMVKRLCRLDRHNRGRDPGK